VQSVIEATVRDIQDEFGVQVAVAYPAVNPAAPPTPTDASVVSVLSEALREVRGIETRTVGIGGGTVAASFRRRGIPAAVWATIDETAHSANEYCVIDNLVADAQVFAQVFMRGLDRVAETR
jgi:succinyl-diaminopimelate desuccinylase